MTDAERASSHSATARRLRLRNEIERGFKQVKWVCGTEFLADVAYIGCGCGGFN